eukprot:1977879-Lingulodinium_polyedra.AAC.1
MATTELRPRNQWSQSDHATGKETTGAISLLLVRCLFSSSLSLPSSPLPSLSRALSLSISVSNKHRSTLYNIV